MGKGKLMEIIKMLSKNLSTNLVKQVKGNLSKKKKPFKKIRILIVEDNLIIRFGLEQMLGQLGYTAKFAKNGKEALTLYRFDYQLILMDIDVPVLDGFEITQIIRAIEKNHKLKNVPIIAITSHYDKPKYQKKCLIAGMNGCFNKPNLAQLQEWIQRYIQNSM